MSTDHDVPRGPVVRLKTVNKKYTFFFEMALDEYHHVAVTYKDGFALGYLGK